MIQGSGGKGQRLTSASLVCLLFQGQVHRLRNRAADRKIRCLFDLFCFLRQLSAFLLPFFVVPESLYPPHFPSPVYTPNCLSSLPPFLPPILHRFIWHVPVLIVQPEPLALFKICIRMLFLYSSKRRHVESLLNCSANRWRFSRGLYEIK